MIKSLFSFISAEELDTNTEPVILLLAINRSDIESGSLSKTLNKLTILIDYVENIRLYRESLVITVNGYDNDGRQLFEIPQVRSFFQHLNGYWPHWIWFLSREFGSLPLLLSLFCKIDIIRDPARPDVIGTNFDTNELKQKIHDMDAASSLLLSGYGIPITDILASVKSAISSISIS